MHGFDLIRYALLILIELKYMEIIVKPTETTLTWILVY